MVGLTAGADGPAQAPVRRYTPQLAALLLLAAAAWAWTATRVVQMGEGSAGAAGMGLPSFLGMWALMMAAMMLPAVAPLAALYSRTVRSRRAVRLTAFTTGYLAVWAAVGLPAFVLARAAAWVTTARPAAATALAVAAYAVCGLYQLTPFKDRCLRHCRSPVALLLHYGSYRGRLRDLGAGAHHGAYCAGCCWALFVVLLAVGVMDLAAMAVLAVVVLIEKLVARGVGFSRVVGVLALGLAVAVIWLPDLAPGLHQPSMIEPMALRGAP